MRRNSSRNSAAFAPRVGVQAGGLPAAGSCLPPSSTRPDTALHPFLARSELMVPTNPMNRTWQEEDDRSQAVGRPGRQAPAKRTEEKRSPVGFALTILRPTARSRKLPGTNLRGGQVSQGVHRSRLAVRVSDQPALTRTPISEVSTSRIKVNGHWGRMWSRRRDFHRGGSNQPHHQSDQERRLLLY